MELATHILIYLVSLGAAYMVISRVKWGNLMAKPESVYGILVRTFAAMFVFAVVFRIGLQILIWLGVNGSQV